jgi:predicted  nucleic acid-binding Zn-ribbon protein
VERSLTVLHPALAAEWHPTLNGTLSPDTTTPGSKSRVWWLCSSCQHVWQARVGSRARGHGCPACARRANGKARSAPKPGQSLTEKFPTLVPDWHPTLNGELTPADVGYASNKKVWWQCQACHHEWQRQVCGRTQHDSGCPECSRTAKEVPAEGNSLAERSPTIAAEWHPTLNGDLTPADVSFSKKAKVWWLCAGCDHEWQAVIGNRIRWPGCPHCGRNGHKRAAKETTAVPSSDRQKPAKKRMPMPKVLPGRSFAERFPETAAEWHPILNGELTPKQVGYASNRKAWWLCSKCAHEWSAVINSRGQGAGCPECKRRTSGRKKAQPKAGGSLAERFPELVPEWHTELNYPLTPDQISAHSGRRVWWRCQSHSHEWAAPVYSRTNGSGCKQCATISAAAAYSIPKPGQSLADRDPEIAAQWHPTLNGSLTPSDVTWRSGKSVYWQCDQGHSWQATVHNRIVARGCPQCTLWGTSVEEIRLRHELQAAGVPIDAAHGVIQTDSGKSLLCDMICPAWKVIIEFDGNYFHRQPGSLEKDRRKTRMLTELGWTVIRVREALPATSKHDVLVPLFSSELVRAKTTLEKLHTLGFTASHYETYLVAESPWATEEADAEIKRPIEHSLATERPDLAAEWDAAKNGPLTPANVTVGSGRKVWWLCPLCDHSWAAVIGSRAGGGHGCPKCARTRRIRQPRSL